MVARIITGSNLYGALEYNQQKVDKSAGRVLATHLLSEPVDEKFSVAETVADFHFWMPKNFRTEKPVIHISLNPDPKDSLTDEQLVEIAEKYMERMGWGQQPYIVFKHSDIEREHIHIVSVQVGRDGKKIKDTKRNERSVAITEELEREYGLHPAKGQKRQEAWQLKAVNHTVGDLKQQIVSVVKPILYMYRFQTLGEFRALMSLYNVRVEEVRGSRNGKPYRGLLYTALDENGQKAEVTPLKSSLLGKSFGYDALEKLMERSGAKIAGDNCRELSTSREQSSFTRIAEARMKVTHEVREHTRHRVAEAFAVASTGSELRERLRALHIDLYIRRNESGRITGATFIDHENRSVFNGSRLGKVYSANALQERFGSELKSGAGRRENIHSSPQSFAPSDEIQQPVSPEVVITPLATLAPETQKSQYSQKRVVPKRKPLKMGN
jgi:hypothetical protein